MRGQPTMTQTTNLFPTTFSEERYVLEPHELDEAGYGVLGEVAAQGFSVEVGFRTKDLPSIAGIALQDATYTYCWKDIEERFGAEETAKQWLAKGRGMVQLYHSSGVLAAYGWVGPEYSEYLPDCENTFAIRVSEEFAGRGLGTLFTMIVVSGSAALYGAQKVGLETWKSNVGAGRVYEKAGATFVTEREDMRKVKGSGKIADIRRYMLFPDTF